MVEFNTHPDIWIEFYTRFGIDLSNKVPNAAGWVSVKCTLPTHPKIDTDHHLGVNVFSGNCKCWNETCKDEYNRTFNRETLEEQRSVLFPYELLMLYEDLEKDVAKELVEAHIANCAVGIQEYHKETFKTKRSTNLDWDEAAIIARKAFVKTNPLVQDYMQSRGLDFKTLKKAGMGYLPETPEQEECLVHIYTQGGRVVGVRGRTADGRKGGMANSFATLYQLDDCTQTTSKTVIIAEGETDTCAARMLLDQAGFTKIPVRGIPGNYFKAEWKRHFKQFTRVIFLQQDDVASQRLGLAAQRVLGNKLEIVELPFASSSTGTDLAEFLMDAPGNAELLIEFLGLSQETSVNVPYTLDPDQFMEMSRKTPEWLIPGLIERGTKVLLVGEPKTYKTWLGLQIMECLVNQVPFLGIYDWVPEEPLKVLFVEEEGSLYRLAERWDILTQGECQGYYWIIHRQGIQLDNKDSLTELRKTVMQLKPDLMIFDPYAALHTQDENSVQGTMVVMAALGTLMRSLPTMSLVLIHHSAKGRAGPRGSSALWGAVDLQLCVEALETPGQIQLTIMGRDLSDESHAKMTLKFDGNKGRHVRTDTIQIKGGETD